MKRFVFLGGTVAVLISAALASAQTIIPLTEWPLPNPNSGLSSIAVDPNGMVYFLEASRRTVGRLDPETNSLTEWQDPILGGFAISRIFVGPDGQIFYAKSGAGSSVLRFDASTNVLTRWLAAMFFDLNNLALDTSDPENPLVWITGLGPPLPTLDPTKNEFQNFGLPGLPLGTGFYLHVDSEGRVWRTSQNAVLVRLDPNTGERIAYADCQIGPGCTPGQQALAGGAFGIRVDEDGKVLVTEPNANKIGQFDPDTNIITEYTVPTPNSRPFDLDIDSGIFFTESNGNKVARLDPSTAEGTETDLFADVATVTPSLTPQAPSVFSLIPVDSQATPSVTEVTSSVTDGFEEFGVPTAMSSPQGIAVAACSIFFAQRAGNKIGRLEISPEEAMRRLKEGKWLSWRARPH